MKPWYRMGFGLLVGALAGCGGGGGSDPVSDAGPPAAFSEFTGEESVTIAGYAGNSMEPFISPDGRFLFFNNSNAVANNTNLEYAERIDDLTFQYRGPIQRANTSELDGVPSMDRNGLLYFVSLRDAAATQATLYRGLFANGALSAVEVVQGIAPTGIGILDFDAAINYNGDRLYVAEGLFLFLSVPLSASIVVAVPQGNGFVIASNSVDIMREVNVGNISYAPVVSRSGLEIFFNRVDGGTPYIYTATRATPSSAFGVARRIESIAGSAEGPTLSPDERSLYYHRKEGNLFKLSRVTRS